MWIFSPSDDQGEVGFEVGSAGGAQVLRARFVAGTGGVARRVLPDKFALAGVLDRYEAQAPGMHTVKLLEACGTDLLDGRCAGIGSVASGPLFAYIDKGRSHAPIATVGPLAFEYTGSSGDAGNFAVFWQKGYDRWMNFEGPTAPMVGGDAVTVASDYAVPAGVETVWVDASSGDITVTLPVAALGVRVRVTKTGETNSVIVATGDGSTINGEATQTITGEYDSATFTSDGTNWGII